MNSEFKGLGFDKYFFAKGMRSIAGQFTRNNRCGIYILHFENSEYYVGLAIDVVNRYTQHRQNHKDIEYVSFKEVAKSKLADIEKETVYALENLKKPLRNINIVNIIIGDTDLDLIVSPEEQSKWINYELTIDSLKTERFEYPELRKKYLEKFNTLTKYEYYEDVKAILQSYVLETIPFPCRTEYSFWSVSCLPSTGDKPLFRLNIFWQETFVVFQDEYINEQTNQIEIENLVLIWLSKSKLQKHFTVDSLTLKFKSLEFVDRVWETGGQDQQCILISAFEFFEFFNTIEIKDAIKEFNLRLMRKGGCNWNRYHCFALADEAVRIDNIQWN